MAEPEEPNVRLSADAKRIVEDAVESGDYASPEAVVEEALRLWQERHEDRLIAAMGGADVVRRLIAEADNSGPSKPLDVEKIKREARRRASAIRSA